MAQHPDFIRFADAFHDGRHEDALRMIDRLIEALPEVAPLYWHRANCLEKLDRHDEVPAALDRVLQLAPDHVPAIVRRVEYALQSEHDGEQADSLHGAADDAFSERTRVGRASLAAEAELRRALAIDPRSVDALALLSNVLRWRDGKPDAAAEADRLLDQAIAIAPARVDLLDARASIHRAAALLDGDERVAAEEDATVQTWSGMRYSRAKLEQALSDYARCLELSGQQRYAVRMGMVLHDLGRHDEALARYDQALASMAADDPFREHVLDLRERSVDSGAGEREQMARLIESALSDDDKDRSLQDDIAAQALLGAANAIRAGSTMEAALEARLSEDPDTLLATSVAQQILNMAHEPAPRLVAADAANYPAYQRRFVAAVAREMQPLQLRHVADAEAQGLFPMLGQHVLIRFFADAGGDVGVAAFAVKPKWPGWLGFALLLLSGKWKVASMVECVSQFDDGTHLSTQHDNPSPFEFGGDIRIERMPRSTPVRQLVARHLERVAAHKAQRPGSSALPGNDLAEIEVRWRAGQLAKRAFLESVGYVTDAELKQLLGGQHERFAGKVRAQLRLLAAQLERA